MLIAGDNGWITRQNGHSRRDRMEDHRGRDYFRIPALYGVSAEGRGTNLKRAITGV